MRVIVCGGRRYPNHTLVRAELDRLTDTTGGQLLVAHGAAPGADTLAARSCQALGIPVVGFPAHWERHGRAAGPIRNQHMLDIVDPHLIIAFPGGAGTADMTRRAERAGIRVIHPEHTGAVR